MSLNTFVLACLSKLTAQASKWPRKKLFILIYHRVMPVADPMRPYEADAEAFDWQMSLLARYFNVLPLDKALAALENDALPSNAVCITFDDGYADNYTHALPILQRYGLSACFFIASDYLNGGRMWNDSVIEALRVMPGPQLDLSWLDMGVVPLESLQQRAAAAHAILQNIKHLAPDLRRQHTQRLIEQAGALPDDLMMSHQQLRNLHQAGMEIGGHTLSHPILAKLDDVQAAHEIQQNKSDLEAILGSSIRFFAYPNGKPGQDYLPHQVALVREAGYQSAVSTTWGVANRDSDRWQLPRFTPWDHTPLGFMQRMLRFYLRG